MLSFLTPAHGRVASTLYLRFGVCDHRLCSAHSLESRSLLLYLPTPSVPVTPKSGEALSTPAINPVSCSICYKYVEVSDSHQTASIDSSD